ncbi:MAG TPA: PEP-utilizing enzyme [Dehalococcoidia bacterium]
MTTVAESESLPIPDDFPVTWEEPEDQALLWSWDQMHHPHPITPLGRDLHAIAYGTGMTRGLRASGLPVKERRVRSINTFSYAAVVPDRELLADTPARMQAIVAERGPGMYQRWLDEYFPEVDAANSKLLSFDYAAATDAELVDFIVETARLLERVWEIHFLLLPGFMISMPFKQLCVDRLGLSGLEAFEMMQGAHNLSVESGSRLWQLAHNAPSSVREVITGQAAATAHQLLQETEEGRAFLTALDEYLQVYGWRKGHFDVNGPAWAEDPTLALDQVRLMLRAPTDPAEDQRRGAELAESRAAECRALLADDLEALGKFNGLYHACKSYPQIQENHNFHIDQKFMALLRLPFLEAGRRLTARGLLGDREDYAYVTLDEINAALRGDATSRIEAVTERRTEMTRWQSYVPPRQLGTRPLPDTAPDWLADFIGAPVEPSGDPKLINGLPAARGTATGTARVVRTLADAGRLEEGDILVCEMTTPAWTPLFASLTGVVADSGGALSHCAVVAREYGLPCVVGTRTGSRTIPDGARITIDGGQGIVRIES